VLGGALLMLATGTDWRLFSDELPNQVIIAQGFVAGVLILPVSKVF